MNQTRNLTLYFQNAIAKKTEYLIEAEKNRAQFENSMKQINEWLCGAETLTDSGYDTLEIENLEDTLSEHQVHQGTEEFKFSFLFIFCLSECVLL